MPGVPLFVWFRGRRLSLPRSLVSSRSPCFTASSVDSPERIWPPSGPLSLVDAKWQGHCPEGEITPPIDSKSGFSVLALVLCLAFAVRLISTQRRQRLNVIMDIEQGPREEDKSLVLPGGVVNGEMSTREYDL